MAESERPGGAQQKTPRILIFAATYNEKGNIEALVGDVLSQPFDCDLFIVDDNSPDGTGQILDELATQHRRLQVLHRPRKLGLGTAHKLAMLYAVRRSYDVLVTMDADYSHSPSEIGALISALDDSDFAIGSRYMPGGTCDYQGYRRNVSVFANFLARNLLGIRLHEFTTSFRAFRVDMLREVGFTQIRSQGYSFFMETVWHVARAGFKCVEVPIHFADRLHGESKIPRHEIFNGARRLIELCFRRLRRWRRPRVFSRPVADRCYLCHSDMVVELYPARGIGAPDASAYRCTSLTHAVKPQVIQCLSCGLAAAGKAHVPENPEKLYADVEDKTYLSNKGARLRTFNGVLDDIAPHLPKPGRLLEVGAYCGLFLDVARQRGWEVEGVELSDWAVEQARQNGISIHHGTLEQAEPQLGDKFDVVVMWDVLEHLADPVGELKRIDRLLADDGVLCLSTLDMSGWLPRLLGKHWPWIMDMHLFYFTTEGLRDLFQRAGFTLIEDAPYRHFASPRYVLEKVAAMLPRPMSAFARLASRLAPRKLFLPFYFGDVKLFVCRKSEADAQWAASSPVVGISELTVSKATGA